LTVDSCKVKGSEPLKLSCRRVDRTYFSKQFDKKRSSQLSALGAWRNSNFQQTTLLAMNTNMTNIEAAPIVAEESRQVSAHSLSARSVNTYSTCSDISNQTGGLMTDATMDIFNPLFWEFDSSTRPPLNPSSPKQPKSQILVELAPSLSLNDSFTETQSTSLHRVESPFFEVNEQGNTKDNELTDSFHDKGSCYKGSSSKAGSMIQSSADPSYLSVTSSLEHLIQSLNQLPQDQDDSDSDEASFLSDVSDISGLTGVFSDYATVTQRIMQRKGNDMAWNSSTAADCKEKPPRQPRRRESANDKCIRVDQRSKSVDSLPCRQTNPVTCNLSKSSRSGAALAASDQQSLSLSAVVQGVETVAKDHRHRGSHRRAVSFDSVQVRHYERILSDNPASRMGPSIGIGWKYKEHSAIKVSQFERIRKKERCRRASELVLSRKERETMIHQLGYSERDMAAVVREINKCRYRRQQTINNLNAPIQKMEEAVETARRKMISVLTLQSIGAPAASSPKAGTQQPRPPQRTLS
jgi:hypothetical protein